MSSGAIIKNVQKVMSVSKLSRIGDQIRPAKSAAAAAMYAAYTYETKASAAICRRGERSRTVGEMLLVGDTSLKRPNEKEISHGRVSWKTR